MENKFSLMRLNVLVHDTEKNRHCMDSQCTNGSPIKSSVLCNKFKMFFEFGNSCM